MNFANFIKINPMKISPHPQGMHKQNGTHKLNHNI